jgi:hypothetical protein
MNQLLTPSQSVRPLHDQPRNLVLVTGLLSHLHNSLIAATNLLGISSIFLAIQYTLRLHHPTWQFPDKIKFVIVPLVISIDIDTVLVEQLLATRYPLRRNNYPHPN